MFTVVSDPVEDDEEDEEGDCLDIATAYVDFVQVWTFVVVVVVVVVVVFFSVFSYKFVC